MSGALLQVAAFGSEHASLMDPGGESLWQASIPKHRNFAIETIQTEFSYPPAFGGTGVVQARRVGDLLCGAVLEVKLKKARNAYPKAVAGYHPVEALVKEVSLIVGGIVVERHTSDWLRVYDSLHRNPEASEHYKRNTNFDASSLTSDLQTTETLYLPMIFTFCRDPTRALPLVAMQWTDVRLSFKFAEAEDIGVDPGTFEASVYFDYAYIDSAEREQMYARPHRILVEQVQYNTFALPDNVPSEEDETAFVAELKMLHPTKAMYWMLKNNTPSTPERTHHARYIGDPAQTYLAYQPNQFNMSGLGHMQTISEKVAPIMDVTLELDGEERMRTRPGTYFNKHMPYQYTHRCPLPGLYMWSFALRPQSTAATGTINLSMFDRITLKLGIKKSVPGPKTDVAFRDDGAERNAVNIMGNKELLVMAWSFNVLVVENGQVSLGWT